MLYLWVGLSRQGSFLSPLSCFFSQESNYQEFKKLPKGEPSVRPPSLSEGLPSGVNPFFFFSPPFFPNHFEHEDPNGSDSCLRSDPPALSFPFFFVLCILIPSGPPPKIGHPFTGSRSKTDHPPQAPFPTHQPSRVVPPSIFSWKRLCTLARELANSFSWFGFLILPSSLLH